MRKNANDFFTLDYIFVQRIGLFYVDIEWARKLMDEYYATLPKEIVDCYHNSNQEVFMRFKDGSTIKAFPACTGVRGFRVDKAIIQNTTNDEYVKHIKAIVGTRGNIFYRE